MTTETITWATHEHPPTEKSADWYWVLGIAIVSIAIASLFFAQYILALTVLVGGGTLALLGKSDTPHRDFTLTERGIEIDALLFPYANLISFDVVERRGASNLLIVDTETILTPHLFIPLTEEVQPDAVRNFLRQYIPEVPKGIPLAHQVTEWFGL